MSIFRLADLSLSRKFTLVAVLALAMAALPATLTVRQHWQDLRAAQEEQTGVAPAGKVLRLVQLTQQHRGLSASVLGGNASAAENRQKKAVEAQAAFAEAQTALASLDEPPLAKVLAPQQAEWQALTQAVAAGNIKAPESFARHTALISAQLLALEDVVRLRGMGQGQGEAHETAIVDRDLVQSVLSQLPELTEWLGQARARGAAVLARGDIQGEDRLRLSGLMDGARKSGERAMRLLTTALADDPSLRGALEAPVRSAAAALKEAQGLAESEIVRAEAPKMTSSAYFSAITAHIDAQFSLIDAAFKVLDQRLQARANDARNGLIITVVVLALLALLALTVITQVARSTTQAIGRAVTAAHRVAEGNLTEPIDSRDRDEAGELLRAMGQMQTRLAHLVGTIRAGAEGVATASSQIAQGNQDLSQRTEEQAGVLQQTASTMEQLGSTVRHNADHAREAEQLAADSARIATQGGEVVGQVVSTMQGISASSRRIGDIIGTIDGIAFQTNILALNAAVEAARAGEQGRGFAVVATEVRTLAQRSAEAAREIKSLVTRNVQEVEQGSALVDRAGTTMGDIVGSINRVSGIVSEISTATREQSGGISQVGDAVSQIDQVTQQNAALVEESAAAAESLRSQAQQLAQVVSAFRLPATMR